MPPNGLQHCGLGGMTQEGLRAHGESSTVPSYHTGLQYQQTMPANNATVFGCPVPPERRISFGPPQFDFPLVPPSEPFASLWNRYGTDLRVSDPNSPSTFYAPTEPSSQGTPTSVSNGSTLGAAPTPTTLNFSWPRHSPRAMSLDSPPPQPQPQTVEPNTLNHPLSMTYGIPWQVPRFHPSDSHCSIAPGNFHQVMGQPSGMGSLASQPSTQQLNPYPISQFRISGQSRASIHPESTSAVMQAQLHANSLFGMTPATSTIAYSGMNSQSPGGSSMGTHSVFSNASQIAPTGSSRPPLNDDNAFTPPGPRRGSSWRTTGRSRTQNQRFEAASAPRSNYVTRNALPKGLDDPLDKRPKPKETAEMTLNMECKVCMAQPVDTAVFPCGHAMLCRWCAEQCMPSQRHDRSRPKETSRCPVCRRVVRQKIRIFLP